jgi:hypothetical protein
MRTKTLLLAAVLGAASVASSLARVYSVNAVGYVNISVPANSLSLIANPLQAANNTIGALLNVPAGTQIYKFNPAVGLISALYDDIDGWTSSGVPSANLSFNPGEGMFIRNNGGTAMNITFVGDVLQGTQTVDLPVGLALVGSKIPQSGGISTTLQFPTVAGSQVYAYNGVGYDSYLYDDIDGWVRNGVPAEPQIAVAQGFWVRNNGTATLAWTRTFSVNTP